MESSVFWLRVAACLYAVGLLHSILVLVRDGQSGFPLARATFRVAVVLHGVAIVERLMFVNGLGGGGFGGGYQTLSVCAFLSAVVVLIVQWRYRFEGISVVLFPLVFGMTLVPAMERASGPGASEPMGQMWLGVHILLVLVGYAALSLTAVAAVAYLIQERRLKQKQSSSLLERLPPLATLDNLISKSLGLGFAFLTLGLVFGIMWAEIYSPGTARRDDSFDLQPRGGCGDGRRTGRRRIGCRKLSRRLPAGGARLGDSVSLPLRRARSDTPSVPRRVQPGFDGGGRAADSGADEIGLRAGQRARRRGRIPGPGGRPGVECRQARSHGDRYWGERGFGELRRGGAGPRDFRGAPRQEGSGDRGGEDGRKRGSSPAASGGFRNPGDQSHA